MTSTTLFPYGGPPWADLAIGLALALSLWLSF